LAGGIEPPAKRPHSPPPQAAGQPERFSCKEEEALRAALYPQIGQLPVELDWLKKKLALSGEVKRQLVEAEQPRISLRRHCALVGVARSGLYYQPVGPSAEEVERMRWLDEQYTATPFYGIRRMTAWLRSRGDVVKHTQVGRLLRTMGREAI